MKKATLINPNAIINIPNKFEKTPEGSEIIPPKNN